MPSDRDPVVIFSGHTVECAFLKSVLDGRGISAFLQDEIMGGTEPFWAANVGETGGVKVIVAARDAEAADRIVQDFLKNRA